MNRPVKLERAGAWRTYLGGRLIANLHGVDAQDSNFPEEWILSTVRARNSGREDIVEGLSMVSGTNLSLAQLIEQNPVAALGERHVKSYGSSLGVLLKLLDSAERLTIQVHPTRDMAMKLFSSPFGKTECWHIIGTREINGVKPCIYLGFRKGITREHWKEVFDSQNIPEMLGCLNRFEVKTGDTFLIEGGMPHAIGAGCFLIEIQEPTDYTIRTERVTPSGLAVSDVMCHQGLGFERMFDCFDYTGYTNAEIEKRWKIQPRGECIIGYDSTKMFRLETFRFETFRSEQHKNPHRLLQSGGVFSGIYILDGSGTLDGNPVKAGDQFFIPASCEPFRVDGDLTCIRFYGPEVNYNSSRE